MAFNFLPLDNYLSHYLCCLSKFPARGLHKQNLQPRPLLLDLLITTFLIDNQTNNHYS